MNFDRLRWGEWIAAIAGLWLVLLVFRAWYEVDATGASITAMDAFDFEQYVFILAGLLGVLLLLLVAGEREDDLSFPFGAVVAVVGLAATALAAYRIASPPEEGADVALGAYLGLLAALGVAIGGLLSARDAAAAPAGAAAAPGPGDDLAAPAGVEDWSAPTSGWTPDSTPAPGYEPAASEAPQPIQAGDTVELTEGSARFPAGTLATVIETFGGGALVEARDQAGNVDRIEVPSDAYSRPSAAADAGWSPAMPSAAGSGGQDWGFDEQSATSVAEPPPAAEPIGGPEAGEAEEAEAKPGFFGRLFGRKPKDESPTEDTAVIEGPGVESSEPVPADHAGDWEEPVASETAAAPEPDYASGIPDAAPEPETVGLDEPPAPAEPEPPVPEPEPIPAPPEPEPEPVAAEPEPEPPAPEPEPPAPEPEPPAPEPEPVAAEPEAPAPEPPAPEPEPEAAPAAEAAAPAAADEPPPKKKAAKKRRKSSATIKKPVEKPPAGAKTPEIGDEVELQVSGGSWEAGTRGTVVDAFAAGVIVEVYGEDGKAERLDLPFEAVTIVES